MAGPPSKTVESSDENSLDDSFLKGLQKKVCTPVVEAIEDDDLEDLEEALRIERGNIGAQKSQGGSKKKKRTKGLSKEEEDKFFSLVQAALAYSCTCDAVYCCKMLLGGDSEHLQVSIDAAGDEEGYTALHVAARFHSVLCVEALLAGGARADVADKRGRIPLETALHSPKIAVEWSASTSATQIVNRTREKDLSALRLLEQESKDHLVRIAFSLADRLEIVPLVALLLVCRGNLANTPARGSDYPGGNGTSTSAGTLVDLLVGKVLRASRLVAAHASQPPPQPLQAREHSQGGSSASSAFASWGAEIGSGGASTVAGGGGGWESLFGSSTANGNVPGGGGSNSNGAASKLRPGALGGASWTAGSCDYSGHFDQHSVPHSTSSSKEVQQAVAPAAAGANGWGPIDSGLAEAQAAAAAAAAGAQVQAAEAAAAAAAHDMMVAMKALEAVLAFNPRLSCALSCELAPLLRAAQANCWLLADALLDAGAPLNEVDGDGNTALHWVLRQATPMNGRPVDVRLVQRLLDAGANLLVGNKSGATPVHTAAGHGHAHALRMLLEREPAGVNVMAATKETPLHYAVKNNHLECVQVLVSHGANKHVVSLRNQRPGQLSPSVEIRTLLGEDVTPEALLAVSHSLDGPGAASWPHQLRPGSPGGSSSDGAASQRAAAAAAAAGSFGQNGHYHEFQVSHGRGQLLLDDAEQFLGAGSENGSANGTHLVGPRGLKISQPGSALAGLALGVGLSIVPGQQPHAPNLPQYKTIMCRHLVSPEGCSYGARCHFAHSEEELHIHNSTAAHGTGDSGAPGESRNALAAIGKTYKTKMCSYFEKSGGVCPHGALCKFAHGAVDLRATPGYGGGGGAYLRPAASAVSPSQAPNGSLASEDNSGGGGGRGGPQAPAAAAADAATCKVFVGGIPHYVESQELWEFFEEQFGAVQDAVVICTTAAAAMGAAGGAAGAAGGGGAGDVGATAHGKPQSRGFGFVLFRDAKSADLAVKMHYVPFRGRRVEVKRTQARFDTLPPQPPAAPAPAAGVAVAAAVATRTPTPLSVPASLASSGLSSPAGPLSPALSSLSRENEVMLFNDGVQLAPPPKEPPPPLPPYHPLHQPLPHRQLPHRPPLHALQPSPIAANATAPPPNHVLGLAYQPSHPSRNSDSGASPSKASALGQAHGQAVRRSLGFPPSSQGQQQQQGEKEGQEERPAGGSERATWGGGLPPVPRAAAAPSLPPNGQPPDGYHAASPRSQATPLQPQLFTSLSQQQLPPGIAGAAAGTGANLAQLTNQQTYPANPVPGPQGSGGPVLALSHQSLPQEAHSHTQYLAPPPQQQHVAATTNGGGLYYGDPNVNYSHTQHFHQMLGPHHQPHPQPNPHLQPHPHAHPGMQPGFPTYGAPVANHPHLYPHPQQQQQQQQQGVHQHQAPMLSPVHSQFTPTLTPALTQGSTGTNGTDGGNRLAPGASSQHAVLATPVRQPAGTGPGTGSSRGAAAPPPPHSSNADGGAGGGGGRAAGGGGGGEDDELAELLALLGTQDHQQQPQHHHHSQSSPSSSSSWGDQHHHHQGYQYQPQGGGMASAPPPSSGGSGSISSHVENSSSNSVSSHVDGSNGSSHGGVAASYMAYGGPGVPTNDNRAGAGVVSYHHSNQPMLLGYLVPPGGVHMHPHSQVYANGTSSHFADEAGPGPGYHLPHGLDGYDASG